MLSYHNNYYCSHTVHMGHKCFLPTAAAEDVKKSMRHSSVVSDIQMV